MKLTLFFLALLAGCSPSHGTTLPDAATPDDLAPPSPTQWPVGATDGGTQRSEYPLILAHGMSGFMNIGPINYFYGIADALRNDGHQVFVSHVDAFNSSDVRGAELLTFVQGVLAQTGAKKVKLICHSQGGFDCRYVANQAGDKVAAIVTISTPHLGDPIADVAFDVLPGPAQTALSYLLNFFGQLIGGTPDQDSLKAINLVSTAGATDFNRRFPDDKRVAYFSIAGRSNGSLGEDACGGATLAPFVTRWNQYTDPTDPVFALAATILSQSFNPPPTNDGLVTVASAKWGTFLGCIPADHMDEVCQFAGDPPGAGNPFDCVLFYRQLADWLVERGF
jgi:triacylglycerol lipase